jgi:4-amino-4-deoxy-L-arabinose transferase-like glycosyltransferase
MNERQLLKKCNDSSFTRRCLYGAMIGLLVAYGLLFQDVRGVWEPSEGRYVCVANEMLRTHDYINPQLNDHSPHWTKPPLTYWAIAGCMKLFGHNTFAVRLPGAIAFLGTLLLIFPIGKIFNPKQPWMPAIIYGTFLFPFAASNIVTTDGILALFETMAVACFASAYWSSGPKFIQNHGALMGWAALGLGFMTKGPPSLLPLLAFAVFYLLSGKNKKNIRLLKPGWGVPLFGVIGGTWYIYVMAEHPDLFHYFFSNEIAGRIFSGQHQRNPQWYGAIAIYVPTLLAGTLPWSIDVWKGFTGIINKNRLDEAKEGPAGAEKDRFLLFWFFIPLVVFFISRSRLALYLLPLFVPLSIAAARGLNIEHFEKRKRVYYLFAWCFALLALRGLSGFLPNTSDNRLIADQIKLVTGKSPVQDIIFVGTKPYLGLSLYFNAEIEKLLMGKASATEIREENISDKLSHYESGRLWVVPLKFKDSFLEAAGKQQFILKFLGQVKGRTVYDLYIDGFPPEKPIADDHAHLMGCIEPKG